MNKTLLSSLLLTFSLSTAHATSTTKQVTLTPEQVELANRNKNHFKRMVGGLKAELYRGRAQNFSAFNLDLNTFIHFHRSPIPGNPNPETFNLASDGNQTIHGVPVWPIQGYIAYYVDQILKLDGQEVTLPPVENVYYLVESEQGHKERLERWSKLRDKMNYQDYLRASGRIIGVVQMDLVNLSIDFYQVSSETNELIRAGVFTGKASRNY